jgi:hypothetical protein
MANTTWNPADLTNVTLTGGNLIATVGAGTGGGRSVASLSSGKYYWENTWTTVNTNSITSGISLASASVSAPVTACAKVSRLAGHIFVNNVDTTITISGGAAVAQGSVICWAVDFTAQLIWVRIGAAGQWNGSGTANPATATGGLSITSITGPLFAMMAGQTSDRVTANFGDTAFTGAVPAGFISGFPAVGTQGARVMVLA